MKNYTKAAWDAILLLPRVLKKFHIDIAGLANNHILDKTPEGLMQTIKILKEQKILFGGAGKNYADASEPVQIEINGLRICFLITAEKELNIAGPSSPGSALFNPSTDPYVIQETKNNCDFLICYVHAGHEFMLTPSPRIRNSFRSFIDAGADAVIGHHPHVPQGYEQYRGGWIFYSLGNLIFDSPYVSAYPNTDIGYLVRLGIKKRKTNSVEIIPYRLRENHMVTELSEQEQHELNSMFSRINAVIADDGLFEEEWAKNVITRWNQDYRKIYQDFSNRYRDDNNPYFLSWMRNMVQCPTHHEIVLKALDLIEEKKLTK